MKKIQRASLSRQVEKFIGRGGEISKIPTQKFKSSGKSRFHYKDLNKGPGEK